MTHAQPQIALTWSAHPARERAAATAIALGAVAALAVAAGVLGGGVGWGLLAAAFLVLALNRFLLPSRFEIDDEGITARYPLRRQRARWTELRRVVHDRHGAFLSRRARPSRLDAFAGLHVLFGAERVRVLEAIRARLPRSETTPWAG